MKIYNPNIEERAFLYKEAQALAPLIKDFGSLSVLVEELTPKEGHKAENRYRVTFVVAPESVGMQVQAENANLYDATIAAKEEAEKQLSFLMNALASEDNSLPNIPKDLMH